jgi:SsrA-binding protein
MAKKSKKKKKDKDDPNSRVVARNRKANREFEILDKLECGIVLRGSEVKSIRDGKISISESFARVLDGEVWLFGIDISEYPQANVMNHDPKRKRKLLLHRKEIRKFAEVADQTGLTLIPLEVYLVRGRVKVTLAVARGRKIYDKRDKLKKQADTREIRGAMMK